MRQNNTKYRARGVGFHRSIRKSRSKASTQSASQQSFSAAC
jgi:hypothetical protein